MKGVKAISSKKFKAARWAITKTSELQALNYRKREKKYSVFESIMTCVCNDPSCYSCWLSNRYYTTTELKDTSLLELNDILNIVSVATGISREDMVGNSRETKIVRARHLFAYFAIRKKKWTTSEIANVLNCNRSTLNNSINMVENSIFVSSKYSLKNEDTNAYCRVLKLLNFL